MLVVTRKRLTIGKVYLVNEEKHDRNMITQTYTAETKDKIHQKGIK